MNINLSGSKLESHNKRTLLINSILFLGIILFLLPPVYVRSQHVDYLYTNFEGYWNTGMQSTKKLNDLNEILAFRLEGSSEIYSTGVDDTKLSANGVSFTPHNFRSLSVQNLIFPSDGSGNPLDGSGGPLLFGFPAKLDGNETTALPPPFDFPNYKVSIPLTMGKKGLDVGSLITNIPNTVNLSFELLNSISEESITDNIPDLFITQEAEAAIGDLSDYLWFTDENGVQIGDRVNITISQAPIIGTLGLDLYRLRPGGAVYATNTERGLRLHAFKMSEFNIPIVDILKIKYLKYNFNDYSDPGLMAYNEDTFKFLKEVCTQMPISTVGGNPSKVGISTTRKATNNWPESIPNGFLVLESQNKGLVLTRTTPDIITQTQWVEGMMIYDTQDKCIKLYNGIFWNCVEKTCNEQ